MSKDAEYFLLFLYAKLYIIEHIGNKNWQSERPQASIC